MDSSIAVAPTGTAVPGSTTLQVRILSWLLAPLCTSPTMLQDYPQAVNIILNAFGAELSTMDLLGGFILDEDGQPEPRDCVFALFRRTALLERFGSQEVRMGRLERGLVRPLIDTLRAALTSVEDRRDIEGQSIALSIQILLPQLG